MSKKRVVKNFESGTLGADLTTGSTTITFNTAPGFATLAADEYIPLIIDPEGTGNGPEIVYLTAYTATQTTGTVDRGEEATSDPGVTHASGTTWRHGPTAIDSAYLTSYQTLTDKTTFSGTTAEQWGTEEATFAQAECPRFAYVDVLLIGYRENFDSNADHAITVQISYDGGSTWNTSGNTKSRDVSGGEASDRFAISHAFGKAGEVTGDIQVRALVQTDNASTTADFLAGRLLVHVKPFKKGDTG